MRRLGFGPGKLVQVIRTSGGSLILALHDEPVLVEATAKRLSGPGRKAMSAFVRPAAQEGRDGE